MSTHQLKVGIAGYGIVGSRRRIYIDKHPRLKTVAICDQKFSHPTTQADGLRCYPNYEYLLKEALDVLFICLPNYLAAEATVAGLRRGLHVFCEKPPGRDIRDVKNVIQTEKECSGLVLKYGFNHRYHDSVREAMRLVHSSDLGEIINLRGVYGKSRILSFSSGWRAERKYAGGGILLDQGIHMVDLFRLFCSEFVDVKSFVSNGYWKHDVEDNAYAIMRDKQGRIAMLHSSATQWQHRFTLDITLTEGFLSLRGILSGSKSYGEEQLIIGRRGETDTGAGREETIKYLEDNSWSEEIQEFADAILNGKKITHGGSREALDTMRLVYRIYSADPEWKEAYGIDAPD